MFFQKIFSNNFFKYHFNNFSIFSYSNLSKVKSLRSNIKPLQFLNSFLTNSINVSKSINSFL